MLKKISLKNFILINKKTSNYFLSKRMHFLKINNYSFLMRQTLPKAMVLQIITLNWYLVSIKFNSVPNNELLKFKK
jgi:hypothetical protein